MAEQIQIESGADPDARSKIWNVGQPDPPDGLDTAGITLRELGGEP
jgi:hypothetical protein